MDIVILILVIILVLYLINMSTCKTCKKQESFGSSPQFGYTDRVPMLNTNNTLYIPSDMDRNVPDSRVKFAQGAYESYQGGMMNNKNFVPSNVNGLVTKVNAGGETATFQRLSGLENPGDLKTPPFGEMMQKGSMAPNAMIKPNPSEMLMGRDPTDASVYMDRHWFAQKRTRQLEGSDYIRGDLDILPVYHSDLNGGGWFNVHPNKNELNPGFIQKNYSHVYTPTLDGQDLSIELANPKLDS